MGIYRKVLCGLDLERGALPGIGERAEAVLRAAGRHAAPGTTLIVLHALPVNPGAPMSPEAAEQAVLDRERLSSQIIDSLLDAVERLTGRNPAEVEVLVEDGPAERAIVEVAARAASDLVVVGSSGAAQGKQGKQGKEVVSLRRPLPGSVARAVVSKAPCSVLVVRPATRRIGD